MALKLLPKACLNFLKNHKSLERTWKKLLENISEQTAILNDSPESWRTLEALIAREEVLFKEIISLHHFLETSIEDLSKKSYLSSHQIGPWKKEQKAHYQSYLAKKTLISHKLKILKEKIQAQREENKEQKIARPTQREIYTKATILDISL